jgi:TonB family protein
VVAAAPVEGAVEPLEPWIDEPAEEKKKPWLLYLAIAALAVLVGVMVIVLRGGGGGPPPAPTPEPRIVLPSAPAPTETPTPEPVATQPVVIPTAAPTRVPPTASPTETVTPTETATETPTSAPPTATPVPDTPTPRPPTATFTPVVHEGDLVSAGPGVTAPVPLRREEPEYPPVAQQLRVEGTVKAEFLVGPDGSVEDFRIISVSRTGVGFERATEEAVRSWRYKPATKNGVKVRTWVTVRVPFTLR